MDNILMRILIGFRNNSNSVPNTADAVNHAHRP